MHGVRDTIYIIMLLQVFNKNGSPGIDEEKWACSSRDGGGRRIIAVPCGSVFRGWREKSRHLEGEGREETLQGKGLSEQGVSAQPSIAAREKVQRELWGRD